MRGLVPWSWAKIKGDSPQTLSQLKNFLCQNWRLRKILHLFVEKFNHSNCFRLDQDMRNGQIWMGCFQRRNWGKTFLNCFDFKHLHRPVFCNLSKTQADRRPNQVTKDPPNTSIMLLVVPGRVNVEFPGAFRRGYLVCMTRETLQSSGRAIIRPRLVRFLFFTFCRYAIVDGSKNDVGIWNSLFFKICVPVVPYTP